MAQKPNFLKKFISVAAVGVSTAAFITAVSNSAMGAAVPRTANANPAHFSTGAEWLPAATVVNGDSLLFSPGNNTIVGDANNTVTINNNGVNATILQIGAAAAGNSVGVAGIVGNPQLTIKMMNNASNLILGLNNVAAGNFAVAGEIGSYVGLLNIDFNNTASNVLIVTNGFTSNATFSSTGGDNGALTIAATGVVLGGDITDISAINLGGNSLSFGGSNIRLADNITFTANETLSLTNTTNPIVINSNIVVTNNQQGIIDGSTLTNAQTLSFVNAKIGNIKAIAGGNDLALGQLNIGSSKASFSGGDVAINELVIGNGGSVQLAHNNYLITKTTNANSQGTIVFNPIAANNTNLVSGTNLGSETNPLAEINFAAPAGANLDTVLNVGQNVNLYAVNITTAGVNTGSFVFNSGGTNIVSGTVGTNGNKFNTATITNGTTVRFLGDAIFNGGTVIGGNSALQLGNNYTADFIGGNAVGDAGTLQFINTGDIIVTLNNNSNPAAGLGAVQVSGSGKVTVNGSTAINGDIDLGTSVLEFASGTSTWGSNTSITTTLTTSTGIIGNIVIDPGAQVNVENGEIANITVIDNLSANFSGTQTYTLIYGGANLTGTLEGVFDVIGTNRFVGYGLIRAENQNYVITRTNNEANVFVNDISSNHNPVIRHNLVTFLNPNNILNAAQAHDNALLAQNANDSAKFLASILTDTSTSINNVNFDVTKEIEAQISNRVNIVRYLGGPSPREDRLAAPESGFAAVAAGDEPIDNVAYGLWGNPFYTDTHQSKKGGVAGYKAKTTGLVIGLDTLANDNLMIGAAIAIAKTDVKHQNYKRGDKTSIDNISFSLYGAQQLVANFFAQGGAIFSVNHVKNKSQRYVFDNNGNMNTQIASANYNNMTFGGNLMVGYDASIMEDILVTPMAGLSYLKSSDESYKETGTTFANRQVNSKLSDRTDFIAGARVMGNTMNIINLAVYPEAHAFVTQKIGGRLSKTQYQLDGQVNPYISASDKTARTVYNLGLSASISIVPYNFLRRRLARGLNKRK